MTLSTSTVWEVRQDGSDNNGGGFVAGGGGTDYSQQAAAQFSGTNLAVDAVTNTKVTSATHNFVAADVGNFIHITAGAGWTTGFYQIVSVASNAATLDRSPAATSTTGGTWALGGALASLGILGGVVLDGMDVYLKYNVTPYNVTTLVHNVSNGPCILTQPQTFAREVRLIGYDVTRSWLNSDANRPTIQSALNGGNEAFFGSTTFGVQMQVCNIIGRDNSPFTIQWKLLTDSNNCTAYRCDLYNGNSIGASTCINCYASACYNPFPGYAFGCVADSPVGGVVAGLAVFCISRNSQSYGFQQGNYINCVSYNSSQSGFAPRAFDVCINCLSYRSGGYGFSQPIDQAHVPSVESPFLVNCAGGSNTSGNFDSYTKQGQGFITLSADPFTNAAGGDFSLNNAAGGGALLRAAGFPGVFPGGLTTGYLDIGALQHVDPPRNRGALTHFFNSGIVNG